MGFLGKIFRRKSTSDNISASPSSTATTPISINDIHQSNNNNTSTTGNNNSSTTNVTSTTTNRKGSWRNGNRKVTKIPTLSGQQQPSQHTQREDSPTQLIVDDIAYVPPTLMNNNNKNSRRSFRGPDVSDGTQRPVLSPRNVSTVVNQQQQHHNNSTTTTMDEAAAFSASINDQSKGILKLTTSTSNPVDLDDSQSESVYSQGNSHHEQPPYDEKKSENDYMVEQPPPSTLNGRSSTSGGGPIFTMPDSSTSATMTLPKLRFSAGNVSVGSDDTDGESSSFNLSTDAEDTEYEAMRRRLGASALTNNSHNMDMSVANYTTDGETSVFPGLQSEDDATQTTASVTKEASQYSILHLPTVNPATGASLVPVGYGNNSSHPYAGTGGFPGATSSSSSLHMKKHTSDRISNILHDEMNGITGTNTTKLSKQTDDMVDRFSKPRNDDTVDDRVDSMSRNRNSNSTNIISSTSNSLVPTIDVPKHDSPEPKVQQQQQRSPKVVTSKPVVSTSGNNNNSFTQYNSHFLEAIYGSPIIDSTTTTVSKQQQQSTSQRRSFTSPKKVPTVDKSNKPLSTKTSTVDFEPFAIDNTTGFTTTEDNDLFADFADFSNFNNAFQESQPAAAATVDVEPTGTKESLVETTTSTSTTGRSSIFQDDKPRSINRHTSSGSTGSSNYHHRNVVAATTSGTIHNETSLSELLEKAKSKSSRSGTNHSSSNNHPKKTSSSVNSAPAMSATYLRQHHHLGKSSRSSRDGTSVTDIIQSLEAANAARITSGSSSRSGSGRHSHPTTSNGGGGGGNSSRDDGFSSAHSRDGTSSVMSAKEKLRRRRERRQQRGVDGQSSDSDDDNEESESWLFDEVTGALGPRGIAADLESLSGRSNRSNSSRGNKSHRSHRSHKSGSRSSRQRRPKSDSADSVDSHHSRDSRRSRGSRYSHRSTRSYISQMSEQSRSVANDLLRLEMQLAMVGSGGGGAAAAIGLEGGSSSVGGIARSTRPLSSRSAPPVTNHSSNTATASTSSARRIASARRSRITIQAPPGRLGIILANKADARGTVVSGVRANSALADRITPGDRIVAIDGEDVSLMTVSEITTIMSRKADFERTLTVLTTPRHPDTTTNASSVSSPRSGYRS